ncbi:hypothetical protein [Indiicoccus explosivorum]|uniref:hypothetical protein n=1 Tax=Indiicoccus explosivorum TaxID=1917864 RepID=UPI000B446966|nr:hypothetical protein [Indiicoccus explosivorum]
MKEKVLENTIVLAVAAALFLLLFQGLKFVWNAWVPWTVTTDVLGLFVILPILLIASYLTSALAVEKIKEANK